MTKQEILDRLRRGNRNYVKDKLEGLYQDAARRETQMGGQSPFAIILSCADSRVVPELIFDTGIGELFVVRVAGNVANTSSVASMEYAVAQLDTELIVVLGHQDCGAVTAAVNGGDHGHNLNHLLEHMAPAIESTGEGADVDEVIRKNVFLTAQELTKRSSIIREAVDLGKVEIIPAYYRLDSGEVEFFEGRE